MSGIRAAPRYRSVAAAPSGARKFTDRTEALATFMQILKSQPSDEQRVLNFYGVGGIGKSRLQQELRDRIQRRSLAISARVDFQAPAMRRQDAALYQLRHCFREEHKLAFPLFDIAYAVYWQRTNPSVLLRADELPLVGDSDVLGDIVQAAGNTPVVGIAIGLLRVGDKLGRRTRQWQRVRNDPDLRQLDRLDAHELLDALTYFFARDLLSEISERSTRCVVFADAHEALWEDVTARGGRGDRDAWLRDLAAQTPGVMWVISSRDGLKWSTADAQWQSPFLERYAIDDLSADDRLSFLSSCGIEGDVAHVIADASRGVPFYLNVSVDHWEAIARDRTPDASDFGHTQADLVDRFIGHVPHAEEELLKVLSVPRSWDRALFELLIRRFNLAYPLSRWPDLCAYSFNRETSGGRWVMHQLMRDELITRISRDVKDEARQTVAEFERRRADDENRRPAERMDAFREAVFHSASAGQIDPAWFGDRATFFMNRGLWKAVSETVEELEPLVDAAATENAPVLNALCAYLCAWVLRQQGRLTAARQAYEKLDMRALEPFKTGIQFQLANVLRESGYIEPAGQIYRQLWERDTTEGDDEELQRLITIQYADYHYVQGRFRTAVSILGDILELRGDGDAKENAEAKRIRGHIERFSERRERALSLYREAGTLFRKCGDVFGEAIIATNLAEALWPIDPAAALERAAEAVERNEAVGARLEVGKARTAAAYAHLCARDVRSARRDAELAVDIQRDVGYLAGEAQARLARAFVDAADRRTDAAAAAALEVGRILEDHVAYPTLRIVASDLLIRVGGDATAAAALRERALGGIQWLEDGDATQRDLSCLVDELLRSAR